MDDTMDVLENTWYKYLDLDNMIYYATKDERTVYIERVLLEGTYSFYRYDVTLTNSEDVPIVFKGYSNSQAAKEAGSALLNEKKS